MGMYKNILVALDLAADNTQILEKAQSVADGGALSAVHVLEPAYFYYGMEPAIGALPDNFEQDLIERADKELAEASGPYGIAPEHQYRERGHAATQVLRLAEDKDIDLIVVGSHGRHGLRLLLGSTANGILHGAKCDVLAVRVTD
jgi:universal stress protein A